MLERLVEIGRRLFGQQHVHNFVGALRECGRTGVGRCVVRMVAGNHMYHGAFRHAVVHEQVVVTHNFPCIYKKMIGDPKSVAMMHNCFDCQSCCVQNVAFYEVVAARASLDVDGGHCHLREGEE